MVAERGLDGVSVDDIATRVTLVWVGGALDSGAYEYNRDTDPRGFDLVFGHP